MRAAKSWSDLREKLLHSLPMARTVWPDTPQADPVSDRCLLIGRHSYPRRLSFPRYEFGRSHNGARRTIVHDRERETCRACFRTQRRQGESCEHRRRRDKRIELSAIAATIDGGNSAPVLPRVRSFASRAI